MTEQVRSGPGPIRVLVVDDSALVRQVLTALLSSEPGFEVVCAHDPIIAQQKMERFRPDVVILDLEMPRMDGLTFLKKLMAEDPIPVVVCSAHTGKGTDTALRALEEGAVDVLAKPRLGVRDFLWESSMLFLDAVRAAAEAGHGRKRARKRPAPSPRAPAPALAKPAPVVPATDKLVAIGASTGGTEALREVLEAMPPGAPGIVVVQHMPEGFTRAFAERLNQICAIEVKEAAAGDHVRQGRALIAPGDQHLRIHRSGGQYLVELNREPLVSRHRPSVDVLFRSVATAARARAVGVIMTGMGADGAAGLLEMKRAGAATIAQDEASCVVFGMPKEAIARGAVDEVVPLYRMREAILRRLSTAG
jgi:two-component system, chemotaxis family, protein-glutamate methylesterase/glutaminase